VKKEAIDNSEIADVLNNQEHAIKSLQRVQNKNFTECKFKIVLEVL